MPGRFANIFSERTIAFLLLLIFAGGFWLFVLVQSAVTSFREDEIRRAMTWMGNSVTYLCSKSFDELMKVGESDDQIQVLLKQAETLETIEDFTRNNSFRVEVMELRETTIRLLLSTFGKDLSQGRKLEDLPQKQLFQLQLDGRRFTGYVVPFDQWHWRVILLQETMAFDNLLDRLRIFYLFFGVLAGMLFLVIVFFLYYSKRTARMLQRSRTRLKATLDSLVEGVIVTDSQGFVQQINPAAREVTGQAEREDLECLHLSEILPVIPMGKEDALVQSDFAQGGYLFSDKASGEYWLRGATGENRLLQVRIARSVDSLYGLNDQGLVLSFNDISERRKIQEKLQQAQKMEVIGLMAGGVAHDLNNILSGIVSYPELLLLKLPEESELRKPVEAIRQSGERAAAVVEDMLTVARGAASAREIVAPATVIEQYRVSPECLSLQERYPQIQVGFSVSSDVANISCSPVHVKKCLHNLLLNGFEAIGTQGQCLVTVRMSMVGAQQADELQLAVGRYAVFEVSDSGPGISDRDLANIFEPFYTRKKMGRSGTGLGLAVVWNTMQDHQGTVVVRSGPQGTQFELYFPATADSVTEKWTDNSLDDCVGQGESILVVDDDPLQRAIASDFLQELSYHVRTAESGEVAVDMAERESFDLVLLDMIMDPGISGRETFERLRRINTCQKALIISGFSDSDDVLATLDCGASGFIKKPYALAELGRAIREVLRAD